MKIKMWCLLVVVSAFFGCKPVEDEKTKYPGELGAWCDANDACDGPLHCTTDYLQNEYTINFCTQECSEDADCGRDGVCMAVPFSNRDYTKTITKDLCVRRCTSTDFCVDLNAETNACYDGNPPGQDDPKVPNTCGFRG